MNELASHVGDGRILAWPKIESGVTSALVTRGNTGLTRGGSQASFSYCFHKHCLALCIIVKLTCDFFKNSLALTRKDYKLRALTLYITWDA